MTRTLLRTIAATAALLCLPLTLPAQERMKELTPEHRRVLEGLPSQQKLLAALPRRSDPVEAAVQAERVLDWFSRLAFSNLSHELSRDPEINAIAAKYDRIAAGYSWKDMSRLFGIDPPDGDLANRRSYEIWQRMYPTSEAEHEMLKNTFKATMDGETLDYATAWIDQWFHEHNRLPPRTMLEREIAKLPEPWRTRVEKTLALPLTLWMAICAAWIVFGIARRTSPFRLKTDDPWTLQKARKSWQMNPQHMTVLRKEIEEKIDINVTVNVDQYGRQQGPANVHQTRKVKLKLYVRRRDGSTDTFTVTDTPMDVLEGHDLLVVTDARNDDILFIHNYDMGKNTFLPSLNRFVKMWPMLLIPVTALGWLIALKYVPESAETAAWVTPLVYLAFMYCLNVNRRTVFKQKFAPQLVEAAGSPRGTVVR
jgi:hypothetical protein